MNRNTRTVARYANLRLDKKIICPLLLLSVFMASCKVKPDDKSAALPVPEKTMKSDNVGPTHPLQLAVQQALADASRRTGLAVATLTVVSAEQVTWPDGSAGCPAPGMNYTQALVAGTRIRIQAGKELLHYHGGSVPKFCPADRVEEPLPNDKI